MKTFKSFKMLAVLIVLITSITQVWAWTPVYLNGNFTENNWNQATYQVNYELEESNSGHYFLPLYTTSGDKYWRFYQQKNYNNYQLSPSTDNYVQNVGTAGYKVGKNGEKNFKSTGINAGVIAVHINQGDGNGDESPGVWLERPTIQIWHNWNGNTSNWGNNGGAGQKAMIDKNNGTYIYDGVYSASGTNVGIEGSAAIKKFFADNVTTKVGSPVSGNKCRFTWNSNGNSDPYKGYDGETKNRGSLTITKILTITYNGNGNEGGTAPSAEEVLYNTATATYTNTGNMTKTNYAFIGWNDKADGTGNHYDAGANITITANKTLYAEWVPCWVLRGGDSNSSNGADGMGDWTPQEMTIIGTNSFMIELTLAASTTYQFKIADRHNGKKLDYSTYTHYGNNGTMSGTTLDWSFSSSDGNCKLSTGASGAGTWRFAWNASSKYLCVYAPADAPKSSFVSGHYVYFDARNNSTWKANPFNAKFWFKNLATDVDDGNIKCNNSDKLDDWVYYALIPENKTWGSVQMNNLVTGTDAFRYDANIIYARARTSANQNCMVVPSSGGSGVTLTWSTYCPPMSDVDLEEDGTTLDWGGNGSSGNPYLIPTSASIKVKATNATKAIEDEQMTIYYLFKKANVAQGSGSSTASKTITASGSTGTKEAVKVEAYNYFNSTEGTHLASNEIYYEVRTPYTISYNKGTNGTGSRDSEIKLKEVDFTLPSSAVFTRDHYTQTGWTTSDGGSQTHALGGSYTSNLAQEFFPVWTDNKHTVTIAAGSNGSVSTTSVSNVGIETTSGDITATGNTGYKFVNWTLVDGVTLADGYEITDATIRINATADSKTITANFTAKQCTVTFDKEGGEGGDNNVSATYDADMTNIEIPHRIGYAFGGYFDGDNGTGNQYYKADGTSYCTWNKDTQSNTTLFAKWTSDVNNFVGEGEGAESVKWNVAANWSRGFVPTNDYSEIHIKRGVNIGEDESYHVGKIIIDEGHSITLINGGVLEVAGTITRPDDEPTETYDIVLSSSGSKQSALILDNTAGNTKASVSLYTTAHYDPSTSGYSFQFVAVPMTIVNVSDAFSGQNVYTYVWNEGSGWERRGYYYSLFGFEAVGVTSKDGATFHTTGTLVSTADIVNRPLAYTSGDGAGMNMFGNSWTAPVKISEIKVTGGGDYAFYIYESGRWQAYSIADAGEAVIPAMQAYLINVTESGSYSINYNDAVRDAANKTAALRAPKRNASDVAKITLKVTDNERQSNLRLYEGEQFSDEYDRGWEAKYIEGDGNSGQLYAQSDEKMVIMATPNMEGTVVGFIPGVADNYTISFEGDGKGYYLNDTELELSTLIAEGNTYEFTPNENTNATRFVISKTPIRNTPTSIEDVNDGTKARKQLIDGVLYIIRDGRIYNITGALYK
ncbi:MAG: InlB B-repeat-containing protein [Paludibacteraceae bacterium]|nr:InlB B-repeat-containing protein [Paludibacteraceae bacterium]